MVEISIFLESFKLFIYTFSLLFVRFYRQVTFILVCYVVTEFLFNFDLSQPLLQLMEFSFKKMRKIILDLLIRKETKVIFRF